MHEEPRLRIWFWKEANMQKLTLKGWVPANPYYLWRAIQDLEFIDMNKASE